MYTVMYNCVVHNILYMYICVYVVQFCLVKNSVSHAH